MSCIILCADLLVENAIAQPITLRENADDTKGAAQTWHSKLPVEWHNSTWTADRAINWLAKMDNTAYQHWI